MIARRENLAACLKAGALGDCIGGPYEGRPPASEVEIPMQPWRLSDDTILSLATARAIARAGKVDPEAIAREFVHAYRAGVPGLGSSTLKALRDLSEGTHWALAGRRGDRAAGNGAAMRIAPLAFFLDVEAPKDRQTIRDVCRITHHNDEAYVGALAVLRAIQADELESIASSLPDSNVRDTLVSLASLPSDATALEAASLSGTSGYVAHSVPLAVFIAAQETSVESAILSAVACGGDTDTIASMVGQILGARGSVLPAELTARLPPLDLGV